MNKKILSVLLSLSLISSAVGMPVFADEVAKAVEVLETDQIAVEDTELTSIYTHHCDGFKLIIIMRRMRLCNV